VFEWVFYRCDGGKTGQKAALPGHRVRKEHLVVQ